MYKKTLTAMTLALAGVFLAAGPAGADSIYDWPSGLPDTIIFNRPIVPGGGPGDPDGNGHERIPFANIQEDKWAAPFVWDDPALPISGVSWWAGIAPSAAGNHNTVASGVGFDPTLFAQDFTVSFWDTDDSGPDALPGTLLERQTFADYQWDWTPTQGAEDSIFRYFHFGASSSSGFFNTWDPSSAGVSAGDTLWFTVELTQVGAEWDNSPGDDSQIRWGRGVTPPYVGSPGLGDDYNAALDIVENEWLRQPDGDVAAFSIHVVPEPATMTLLGLGLAGFVTRRFMSRKKA